MMKNQNVIVKSLQKLCQDSKNSGKHRLDLPPHQNMSPINKTPSNPTTVRQEGATATTANNDKKNNGNDLQ